MSARRSRAVGIGISLGSAPWRTTPLLAPLPAAELGRRDAPRYRGAGGEPLNIFGTLAHHPKLMKRWMVFGNHVLAKSTLPARDRELLILRTGWNCRAPYEWGQHVAIARAVGHHRRGDRARRRRARRAGWDPFDALLLRAADELHDDAEPRPTRRTRALAERYDEQQLLDLVFTVGQYHLVSMALNTFRVERDDGVTGVPIPERDERHRRATRPTRRGRATRALQRRDPT